MLFGYPISDTERGIFMANKEWLKKGADGISFGERLGDLIANNRTTATALARDTGLSQSAISDYLNKDRAPDCATIYSLARYFSVSADYLLGLSDIKTPSTTTQAIIDRTGLTEDNTKLLETLKKTGYQVYLDFINELIAIVDDSEILVSYLLMQSTLTIPQSFNFSNTNEDLHYLAEVASIYAQAKEHGCICLTGKQAFEYYCSQIAREMEKGILKHYESIANWGDINGID